MIPIQRIAAAAFALTLFSTAWAQGTVKGKITDEQGTPLPSATVAVTGGTGVFTDFDGNYELQLAAGEYTLACSYIGYLTKTKKVSVKNGETVTRNIRLSEDAVMLNESVVVGYGVQRKKEVTGSIATIDSKEITAVQTPSFEAALQGQAAGVQVTQGSGMAGSASIVRIRGLSSISAGGDPLYVVDGIPITQDYFAGGNSGAMNRNPLASLNPNDIKDIQVLKDAAATGIYGSRGANGVILITTKRGRQKRHPGQLRVFHWLRRIHRHAQHDDHRGIPHHPSGSLGKRRRHRLRVASLVEHPRLQPRRASPGLRAGLGNQHRLV